MFEDFLSCGLKVPPIMVLIIGLSPVVQAPPVLAIHSDAVSQRGSAIALLNTLEASRAREAAS